MLEMKKKFLFIFSYEMRNNVLVLGNCLHF